MIHEKIDHVEQVGLDKSVWSRVWIWICLFIYIYLSLWSFVYFHHTKHKPNSLSFIPNDPIRLYTKIILQLRIKRYLPVSVYDKTKATQQEEDCQKSKQNKISRTEGLAKSMVSYF